MATNSSICKCTLCKGPAMVLQYFGMPPRDIFPTPGMVQGSQGPSPNTQQQLLPGGGGDARPMTPQGPGAETIAQGGGGMPQGPAMVLQYFGMPPWDMFPIPGMVQGSQGQSPNTQQQLLRGGGGGARPMTPQGPDAETMAQGGGGMPQGKQGPGMSQGQNPNTQQQLLHGGGATPMIPQGPGAETMAQGDGGIPEGMQGPVLSASHHTYNASILNVHYGMPPSSMFPTPGMVQGSQGQNPNAQQLLRGGGARPMTPQGPGAQTMAQVGGGMPQSKQGPGMVQGSQGQNPNTQQLHLRGGGGGARPMTPQGPGAETMAQGGGGMPQGMQGPGMSQGKNPNTQQQLLHGGGSTPMTPQGPGAETMAEGDGGMPQGTQGPVLSAKYHTYNASILNVHYGMPPSSMFPTPCMVQGSQGQNPNAQQLLHGGGARPVTPQGPDAETMAQVGGGMPQGMQGPGMSQGQNPKTQQQLLHGGGTTPMTPQGAGAETMAEGDGGMPQGTQGAVLSAKYHTYNASVLNVHYGMPPSSMFPTPGMVHGSQGQNPNAQQQLLRGGGAMPMTLQGPSAETMAQVGGMPQGIQGPGLPCEAGGGQQNAELKSSWSKHNLAKEDEMQKKTEFDIRITNSSPPIECLVENLQLLSPPLEPCSLNGSNTDNHKMKNKFDSMNNVPNHTRQEIEKESCTYFGRYVTAELKQMPKQQRIRAKGLLAKIFLGGEVGCLQMNTTVTALNVPSAQQEQHTSFNKEFDSTNNMKKHKGQELYNECVLFGQLVAAHLQVMPKIQKALAQRLMSEILFRGELEFLWENTTLLH